MEKHVTRVLNFSADEIKTAIMDKLVAVDQPYPLPSASASVKFSLSDTGATLEWVEQCEMNL
jgi:hypothetical protein